MDVSFKNRDLRKLCESKNRAKRQLGEVTASKLMARLADIRVFNKVEELIVSQIFGPIANNGDHIKIELDVGCNIVFCANHINVPLLEDGTVDWSKVARIKILKVGKGND